MATEYPVSMKLQLRPVGNPWVRIGLDSNFQEIQLTAPVIVDYDFDAVDTVALTIEHFNKHDHDIDTAVEITGISFYGISDPKFLWAGAYYPDYPKTWYSQQTEPPAECLPGQTYLGWNGVYKLQFSVPIFTWIHQVQDLGWIYE